MVLPFLATLSYYTSTSFQLHKAYNHHPRRHYRRISAQSLLKYCHPQHVEIFTPLSYEKAHR